MGKYTYSKEERALIERSFAPLLICRFAEERTEVIAMSQGFADMFKIEDREQAYANMGSNMFLFTHPEDKSRVADMTYRFASGQTEDYKVIYRCWVVDEYRVIRAWGKHLSKEKGEVIYVVWFSDEGPFNEENIKEGYIENASHALMMVIKENSQSYNASYDYLTGLPNMARFLELAEAGRKSIEGSGRIPVMLFFDISGMKVYNEKFGFSAGDELLRQVAEILKKYFTLDRCGRMSGDHFAAFTVDEELDARLNALLKDIEKINGGNSLPVRIGVYGRGKDVIAPSIAADRAKMACDTAKKAFVSSINYFDDAMLEKEEMRRYVTGNIDRAIEEGWITVYHQPIVRAANSRVSDEEALARWIDPEKGMIMPDVFVPILEDARLVYKLDLYMTELIIRKMQDQISRGLHVVPESVNLSREDFFSCDMVEEIKKRMDDAGMDYSRLTIEITESMVGSDVAYIKEQVERFQKLGFKVWMDDYGNGYSSPALLQQIHFDTIKFDMQYMRDFDKGDANRIILTQLVKMAISLGIETVVEGVETEEQVEFLKEIGCTKLQGYYYTKPLSYEELLDRNTRGPEGFFENPEESEYYEAIGSVNLYDMTVSAKDDDEYIKDYFNTMPMAIMELSEDKVWIARANRPYKDFFAKTFGADANKPVPKDFDDMSRGREKVFQNSLRQCALDGHRVVMDERTPDGKTMHVFIRRVAINPVTGVVALAVVILGVSGKQDKNALTYTYVAQVLSSDYIDLFLVDLDTEEFIEYGAADSYDDLAIERHGGNFFEQCYRDARTVLYRDDVEQFILGFTKDKIMDSINDNGVFNITYRMMRDGQPFYAHMKAVPVREEGNKIIIGISNIDAQMKQQESFERIKEERITFNRISALSGDYVFIFVIDPETGRYTNYISKGDIENYNMHEQGEDFFEDLRKGFNSHVYVEDMELVRSAITKENVMENIRRVGGFSINFRVVYKLGPVYMNLKAVIVEEKDGNQLIVGVSNINEQVKREQTYVNDLTAARNEANRDALTGVKNKHAYIDVEAQIDRMIDEKNTPEFAVVVMDINDLKLVNDTQGHHAGDELIRRGCNVICGIFRHSPVFRVGGDEFAIIAQGGDFINMDKLMTLMEEHNLRSLEDGDVVIACGMARYHGEKSVSAVFDKADSLMYANKHRLKEQRKE